jgi:hypothetical protein
MAQAAVTRPAIGEKASESAESFAPSFPDLVWAHYRWESTRGESDRGNEHLDREFRTTLRRFEEKYGPLVSVYWSRTDASAVGVTEKAPPRWRRLIGMTDSDLHFHRATDWVTRDVPKIPDALNECETLAVKVREVLRSTSERVAMQWIFSLASHLLGYVERVGGKADPVEAQKVADDARLHLLQIDAYYERAGTKAGRIVYAAGMFIGVFALVVIGFAAAAILWAFNSYGAHSHDIQIFFACYAAGALGAIVSVLSRMASPRNAFMVDFEVGRPSLRLLGLFRPLLGAIFGLAAYFALKAGLLQITPKKDQNNFYWFTSLAFVAGFSERFTKVLMDSIGGVLPGMEPARRQRTQPHPGRSPDAGPPVAPQEAGGA